MQNLRGNVSSFLGVTVVSLMVLAGLQPASPGLANNIAAENANERATPEVDRPKFIAENQPDFLPGRGQLNGDPRAILNDPGVLSLAGTRAQFGAEQALYFPVADGKPARIAVNSSYTSTVPFVNADTGGAARPQPLLTSVGGMAATPGATATSGKIFLSQTFANNIATFDIARDGYVKFTPLPANPAGAQPGAVAFVGDAAGNGTIFVDAGGTIFGVDAATGNVVLNITVPFGHLVGGITPGGDATPRSGSLLISDEGSFGQIIRLDIATGAILETKKVFPAAATNQARQMTLVSGSRAGDEVLLISNFLQGKSIKYDYATGATLAEYPQQSVNTVTYAPGPTPGTGKVFSFDIRGTMLTFSESGSLLNTSVSLGEPRSGVGFRPNAPDSVDGEVFVTDRLATVIKVYDTVSQRVTRSLPLPAGSEFSVINMVDDGSYRLAVGLPGGQLQLMNPDTGNVERTVNLKATGIGRVPGTSKLLVSNEKAQAFTVLDANTGAVTAAYSSLNFAPGMAVSGTVNGQSVYLIPDLTKGQVQVRDAGTFTLIKTLNRGPNSDTPRYVDQLPNGNLITVSQNGIANLIDPNTGTVLAERRSGFGGTGVRVVSGQPGQVRAYVSDTVLGISMLDFNRIVIAPEILPEGLIGTEYKPEVNVYGTPKPTLTLNGLLPPGLSFDAATGKFSGVPTLAGKFTVSLAASNGGVSADVTKDYTITVDGAPKIEVPSLGPWTVGQSYDLKMSASGAPIPTWEVSAGALPKGMNFDPTTARITGTPEEAGDSTFTLKATNEHGTDAVKYDVEVGKAPTITTLNLPDAAVNSAYRTEVKADAPMLMLFNSPGDSLPAGFDFNTVTGEISGTTAKPGRYTFAVQVSNKFGSDEHRYTLLVRDPARIVTESLPDAKLGEPYSVKVETAGFPEPLVGLSGKLPEGLRFDAVTSTIVGTPTKTGNYEVSVTATDPTRLLRSGAVKKFVFAVNENAKLQTETLPDARQNNEYSVRLAASGFPDPTFQLAKGKLPAGLKLDRQSGEISGTPSQAETARFTVRATNSVSTDEREYTLNVKRLKVVDPPAPPAPPTPPAKSGLANTGADPLPGIGILGALLITAAAALEVTRRLKRR